MSDTDYKKGLEILSPDVDPFYGFPMKEWSKWGISMAELRDRHSQSMVAAFSTNAFGQRDFTWIQNQITNED